MHFMFSFLDSTWEDEIFRNLSDFFLNAVLVCYCHFQIKVSTLLKDIPLVSDA